MVDGGDKEDSESKKKVPTVDADVSSEQDIGSKRELQKLRDELELRTLKAERDLDGYVRSEWRQKLLFRWVAILMSLYATGGCGVLIYYLVEKVFIGPFMFVNTAFSVVMITAPILAITTIVGGVLLAAFRSNSSESGSPIVDAAHSLSDAIVGK